MPTKHSVNSGRPEAQTTSLNHQPHMSAAEVGHKLPQRCADIFVTSPTCQSQVGQYIALALKGLPRMHECGAFGYTLRAATRQSLPVEELDGDSLRYTAIVVLGVSYLAEDIQRRMLGGKTASELAGICVARAEESKDLGAIALAAWAAAEAGGFHATKLFLFLRRHLVSGLPIETVSCAWALTASLAAAKFGDTELVLSLSAQILMEGQSQRGLFPHMFPSRASGRLRAHIGCFADQIYPIQALSRLYAAHREMPVLRAAEACARLICTVQGPAGQWWWHYDTRTGKVTEGYPVYSVHQHGMAPMALLDLKEAGGQDHTRSVARGLQWLHRRPELAASLVEADKGVIWRKIARRDVGKAVRRISALTTAVLPGLHFPGLNFLFPPNTIDRECRPYELGWLLYAWLSGGTVTELSSRPIADSEVN